MKKKIFTALLLLCVLLVAAEAQETKKSFTVEVSNTWNKAKADEPVVIKLSEIKSSISCTLGCCHERVMKKSPRNWMT